MTSTSEIDTGRGKPQLLPVIVAAASVVSAGVLGRASISADENPAILWFGVASILCASLAGVVMVSTIVMVRSPRSSLRWIRVGAWSMVVSIIAMTGLVLGAEGADSWCRDEGFSRGDSFGQSLSLSAWPPGVTCTLILDGTTVEVAWPVDW